MMIRSIGVVVLFGILGCNANDKEKSVSNAEEDRRLENIRLLDMSGKPINLEQYKGKTVFLNFWATWCKPCLEEMPTIEKAQNLLRNEEVVFLMASFEDAEEIDEFRNTRDYKFNYIRVDNSEELSIQALPTTYIFDPGGKLVFSATGYRRWDEKNNIDMILKISNKNE